VKIKNISINKLYSVDREDNLTPFFVGRVNDSQEIQCNEGGNSLNGFQINMFMKGFLREPFFYTYFTVSKKLPFSFKYLSPSIREPKSLR